MKIGWFVLFLLVVSGAFAQDDDAEKVTSVSNVGLTIKNNGVFGNAFRGNFNLNNAPSGEYPVNSGIEHLFESGFWIGAKVNGITSVSTSAYDNSSGYGPGRAGYEFTVEESATIEKRSSLVGEATFTPEAISHEDLIMDMTDGNQTIPGTNIQISGHDNPMGLDVHLETYNWNFSFSDFMVICNYTITNNGPFDLNDLYFGTWSNTVVRNVNITPAGQGGAGFYNKGGNGYEDSLYMAYCYDATGDVGFTESYVGHKFLGAELQDSFYHPDVRNDIEATYNAWVFNNPSDPLFFIPTSDLGRYQKMELGLNENLCWDQNSSQNAQCPARSIKQLLNDPGNRADLVAVGPFPELKRGESMNVAWAWVFGKKVDDGLPNTENNAVQREQFLSNSSWAQTAYNGEDQNFDGILQPEEDRDGDGKITRFILPTPPDIPNVKVVPSEGAIDIYWTDNSEQSIDPISKEKDFAGYKVYVTPVGFDVVDNTDALSSLKLVGEYDIQGDGRFKETGFSGIFLEDAATFDGDTNVYRYKTTISPVLSGWQYAIAVTAFDKGDEQSQLESLESARLASIKRVFPGTPANDNIKENQPYAYPNPYIIGAAWEGASQFQEDSKITFANLPNRCVIRIFTPNGDLIKEMLHEGDSYTGTDSRWFETYSDTEKTVFAGGEHSWDLLSEATQIIARGLYTFSVEDLDSGERRGGKFAVIK